jgi:hypothetical protein
MAFTVKKFHEGKKSIYYFIVLLAAMVLLSACVVPVPAGQEPQAPASTQASTPEPISEPTPEPTLAPTPEPVAEATPDPTHYFPTPAEAELMMQLSRYLIDSIPQPIPAPEGWQIRPCEGMAPLLCVETAAGESGLTSVDAFALRTYPDFYPILERHGLPLGSIDVESQAYQEGAPLVLAEIVGESMTSLAADRAMGRPQLNFIPLEVQPIQFGELPGLQYGFMMTGSDGVVHERVLSHVTFDESHLYFWVAAYDPGAEWALPSDEALLTFEPYLRQFIAGLPLPVSR